MRHTKGWFLRRNEAQHECLADGNGAQAVRDVDVAAAREALLIDALDVVADLDALHLRQLAALADRTNERIAGAVVGDCQAYEITSLPGDHNASIFNSGRVYSSSANGV